MARNNGTKAGVAIVTGDDPLAAGAIQITPPEVPSVAQTPALQPPSVAPALEEKEASDEGVEMRLDADMAEAGRTILQQHLRKLQKAEPVAREGVDPEGVHDMRVAARRLRAALQVLEETVYQPKVARRYRQQLRGLAQALGDTRDNDVFLEHLDQYRAKLTEVGQAGIEPLRQEIVERQARARKVMLKKLDSSKTHKLLSKLEQFTSTPGAGVIQPGDDPNESDPTLVRHFVTSAVWRRYEEVLAYETRVGPVTPVGVLHRLRVAAKRLRYTLEFFQDGLPPTARTLHKQLVDLQDELGAIHDHQVAIELCEKILQANQGDESLQAYQDSRTTELEKLRASFLPHWQTLIAPAYKTKLAGTLIGKNASV